MQELKKNVLHENECSFNSIFQELCEAFLYQDKNGDSVDEGPPSKASLNGLVCQRGA